MDRAVPRMPHQSAAQEVDQLPRFFADRLDPCGVGVLEPPQAEHVERRHLVDEREVLPGVGGSVTFGEGEQGGKERVESGAAFGIETG